MYSQDWVVSGTNNKVYSQVKCHGCGQFGHYLSHCLDGDRQQNLNIKEEPSKAKGEEEEIAEGDQHMQIEEIMDDVCSSSSDGLYLIDFKEIVNSRRLTFHPHILQGDTRPQQMS